MLKSNEYKWKHQQLTLQHIIHKDSDDDKQLQLQKTGKWELRVTELSSVT